ncbi:MAG: aminoacyl-tRNA hydrolase [Gammaproteobacteria bacterium]|nr:MAG: aminoacyl-tRNA hydrolase [Gammaproteobacteria bacterium]
MAAPALVVGLGNPGPRYADTRHNAGVWCLEAFARRLGVTFRHEARFHASLARYDGPAGSCRLLRPETFMNDSGRAVAAAARYFRVPVEAILVIHDDLDLPPGAVRLKQGGGDGGHNGLKDIIRCLGGRDFVRLRLGIGHPGSREEVVSYVLAPPRMEERILIERAIDAAVEELPLLLAGSWEQAMTRLHAIAP